MQYGIGKDEIMKTATVTKENTKIYSIRQVAQLTGKSVRTIHNYISDGKIECLRVDNFILVTDEGLARAKHVEPYRKPGTYLHNHMTIVKAAHHIGISAANLKWYVLNDRIPEHVVHNGIYFIPDATVQLWQQVKPPINPNTVEAFTMDAVTIQAAGLKLGYSDGHIRQMVRDGRLTAVRGFYRNYVTLESISDIIEQTKLLNEL